VQSAAPVALEKEIHFVYEGELSYHDMNTFLIPVSRTRATGRDMKVLSHSSSTDEYAVGNCFHGRELGLVSRDWSTWPTMPQTDLSHVSIT
jgi:hypothetical protein